MVTKGATTMAAKEVVVEVTKEEKRKKRILEERKEEKEEERQEEKIEQWERSKFIDKKKMVFDPKYRITSSTYSLVNQREDRAQCGMYHRWVERESEVMGDKKQGKSIFSSK